MGDHNKQAISITDKAAAQIQSLMNNRSSNAIGIRICVKQGGCSGFKYYLEYAEKKNLYDEVINNKNITLFIDYKALMYLIGSEMDYVEEQFSSGFTFKNPNEKARCGCGKSFSL